MAVLPATRLSSAWADVIEHAMAPYRKATIQIFDPSVYTEDKPYDFVTNIGGVRTYTIMWSGLARIVELNLEKVRASTDEWITKRDFHFDIALTPNLPFFHKGLRIKVLDGHKDHALEKMVFTIMSAGNSSEANQRDILATTEGAEAPIV